MERATNKRNKGATHVSQKGNNDVYRVYAAGGVHQRSDAKKEANVVQIVENGTLLRVLEREKGWGRVVHKGAEGWVSLAYVRSVDECK